VDACSFLAGEYDDRPRPIRDLLVSMIRSWQRELVRAIKQAIDVGHLRPDTDPISSFSPCTASSSAHHDARLMPSKDSIVRCRAGLRPAHRSSSQPRFEGRSTPPSQNSQEKQNGQYVAPRRDMQFVLHELLHVEDEFKQLPPSPNQPRTSSTADGTTAASSRAKSSSLSTTWATREAHFRITASDHPKGFKDAYDRFAKPAASIRPDQPSADRVSRARMGCTCRMIQLANQAFAMYPSLTHGAYEALHAHRNRRAKERVPAEAVAGQWNGQRCA